MNQLLDFAGALLYIFVSVVTAPLILLVYGLMGLCLALKYIYSWLVALPIIRLRLRKPPLPLYFKRYFVLYKH